MANIINAMTSETKEKSEQINTKKLKTCEI